VTCRKSLFECCSARICDLKISRPVRGQRTRAPILRQHQRSREATEKIISNVQIMTYVNARQRLVSTSVAYILRSWQESRFRSDTWIAQCVQAENSCIDCCRPLGLRLAHSCHWKLSEVSWKRQPMGAFGLAPAEKEPSACCPTSCTLRDSTEQGHALRHTSSAETAAPDFKTRDASRSPSEY